MATIEDLDNKSILKMGEDELYEHIMTVRRSRRVPKKVAKKSTPKMKKEKSTGEIMDMLSPSQAEALIKRLEG